MASARVIAAVGAGATVVLGVVTSVVLEQVGAGWGWWIALAAVVALSACLAGFLAFRQQNQQPSRPGPGGVGAGRDITARVSTRVSGLPTESGVCDGAGAVQAGRDIAGEVSTHVDFTAPPAAPAPPADPER
ncbi:hypothetical protein [Streptomyces azureus]|uniref:Ribose transport system permease protein RbsC n=1 Tax=Streptomyces azureus TaxID=146537 RepID=A0A0K8PRD8_STRAJ|nr:hypothetical protein [Streptomyces azureus]GAP50465.1 ribose transport system permease protein RbsC [Streptomyces azureus]